MRVKLEVHHWSYVIFTYVMLTKYVKVRDHQETTYPDRGWRGQPKGHEKPRGGGETLPKGHMIENLSKFSAF